MNKYKNLMSMFNKDECVPVPNSSRILVIKHQRKTPFLNSTVMVQSKTREKSTISDIITSNTATILFYGSPYYKKSQILTSRLKKLLEKGKKLDRRLDIVYIPLFTYHETVLEVEDDFFENHGNWWMMGFQTWESVEAVYMHRVDVVPSLVVVDGAGGIITESGQNDITQFGNDVLITWF